MSKIICNLIQYNELLIYKNIPLKKKFHEKKHQDTDFN